MEYLFWSSIFLAFYAYLGYPATLWLLTKRPEPAESLANLVENPPIVSLVIAVRNEASNIERRLRNILDQDYPLEKIELILVSDGSTDTTVEKIEQLTDTLYSGGIRNVRVFALEYNYGKPNALNLAIEHAEGEFIIMADARQVFDTGAITALVAALQQPAVGCVSGELHLIENDSPPRNGVEMGLYWRYERFIRQSESRLRSVVGMTGAIYAIRRTAYQPIPTDTLIDDVLIPMNVIRQGLQAKFTTRARAFDRISQTTQQEWQRKVRTMAGNWQLLFRYRWLWSPIKNPIFFYFFSHKVLRLLVPFAVAAILSTGYFLTDALPRLFTIGAIATILTGFIGFMLPTSRTIRIVSLAYFFSVLNLAVLAGLVRYLAPNRGSLWSDAHKETLL